MNDAEAFRFGFLLRCCEEGLSESEMQARLKSASEKQANAFGLAGDVVKGTYDVMTHGPAQAITGAALYSIPAAIGAGLLTGGGLGMLAGKAMDPGYTPEDIKRMELIQAYNSASDDIEDRKKTREELGEA